MKSKERSLLKKNIIIVAIYGFSFIGTLFLMLSDSNDRQSLFAALAFVLSTIMTVTIFMAQPEKEKEQRD